VYTLQGGKIFRQLIRQLHASGLTDCYRYLHPIEDGFTIPTPYPKVRLDYIFANAHLLPALQRCDVVIEPSVVRQASDHYPLLAEFELS
jgi:exonuclease III